MMHRYLQSIWLLILIFPVACGNSQQQLARLSDDAVILTFGDSLTYGSDAAKNESYPAVLERLIHRKIINAGISGELSTTGLKRLPSLLDKYQPDLLILCHGGNDILKKKNLAETETNIRQMISLAQDKNIPVILLGVPKPGLFLNDADLYNNIADSTDIIFIPNLIAKILSEASLKSDPVHPNKAGYRKITESLADTLRKSDAL